MNHIAKILVCAMLCVFMGESVMAEGMRDYKINKKESSKQDFEIYKSGFDIEERFFEEGIMAGPSVETHYHATEKKTGKKYVYIVKAWAKDVAYEIRPEYTYREYGEPFPMGDYVFDDGLTVSIQPGGHKRSRVGGPYRSWVEVYADYNGVSGEFSLYSDKKNDKAPKTYTETVWEGFLIKRLGEDEFVVTPQKSYN